MLNVYGITAMNIVSKFFHRKFWEWQAGEIRTQKEFAEYLGVKEATLSHWINGARQPDYKSCVQLAEKLGDEVYAVCGFIPPDERLREIILNWGDMSEYAKVEVENVLEEHQRRKLSVPDSAKRTSGSKIDPVDK